MRHQILSCVLVLAISVACLPCQADPFRTHEQARQALEDLYDSDQKGRLALDSLVKQFGLASVEYEQFWRQQSATDKANLQILLSVIDEHGWPSATAFGRKSVNGAFLVVQHSNLETQKLFLPTVKAAAAAGEASFEMAALLEDRVLTEEGKKQIYGTQLQADPKTGKNHFFPIEDEANVDTRRAKIGLPPLREYAAIFGVAYTAPQP